jgi:hypothetical protein
MILDRTIGEYEDSAERAVPVAVAGYSWFQRHFNRDPSALGDGHAPGSTE